MSHLERFACMSVTGDDLRQHDMTIQINNHLPFIGFTAHGITEILTNQL